MAGGPGRLVTHLGTPIEQEVRDLYAYTNPDQFSNISDENLASHITQVRDKAYKIAPWPCLGAFRFLTAGIANSGPSQAYSSILAHLRANPDAKVLDLGCCFGHDARQLLKDGVHANQVVACDLVPELMDLGFEMFADQKDKGYLQGLTWEKVDVFNQEDLEKIAQPKGYHAIYVGSFIHLFPLEYQKKVVTALDFLLSKEKGSKIWGRQVGTEHGNHGPRDRIVKGSRGPVGIKENEDGSRDSAFYHSPPSFKDLFEQESKSWEAEVVAYEWSAEKWTGMSGGDGVVMIDPAEAKVMKRLSFVVVRK